MEAWETEEEKRGFTVSALPTPEQTPRRTPSRASKKSRRSMTPPAMSSSSTPRPSDPKNERSSRRLSGGKVLGSDEPFSPLDPRRFTPTLHANLVSEILALRRDQEEKMKVIETLELSLQESREEQEALQAAAIQNSKEGRSLKRQLALLEGGTSSALSELSRERDEAVDAITDTRKRLEIAQKKARSQEEDSEKMHKLWAQEKDDWEEEKRKYERKLHVADTRLKVVLEEIANLQAAQAGRMANGTCEASAEETHPSKDFEAASIRTMSPTNSIRFSVMSPPAKVNGHSLADELDLDGDDDDWQSDQDGRQSALSHNGHNRTFSRDSVMSKTHRRNTSLESPSRPVSVARGKLFVNQSVLERLRNGICENDELVQPPVKVSYTDTGIQYSPPPSPQVQPVKPSTPEPVQLPKLAEMETSPRNEAEVEANQSRKRVYASRPVSAGPWPASSSKSKMVSSGVQTVEESSLLATSAKKAASSPPAAIVTELSKKLETHSISTQTEAISTPAESVPLVQPTPRAVMSIPSISIIPPTSRSATPDSRRLPQYVKDFGCQVSITMNISYTSTAAQTDEIRVDRRLDKLPAHLHPSAITSRPATPAMTNPAMVEDGDNFTPHPNNVPPRNPRRLTSMRSLSQDLPSSPPESPNTDLDIYDSYPGNNDDGPVSGQTTLVRRPPRVSSLFAGFEASSDDGEDFKDCDFSDGEYQTALSAPRHTGSRQSQYSSPAVPSSPEQNDSKQKTTVDVTAPSSPETKSVPSKLSLRLSARYGEKPTLGLAGSRSSVMRKAVMIQNGIASHQNGPRSPSLTDTQDPPFPIPTRASSRRPDGCAASTSDGQLSPDYIGDLSSRRAFNTDTSGSVSVRKVRSAAHIPRSHRRRRISGSPPPMSPSTEAPETPGLPPLPTNDLTSRPREYPRYKTHKSRPSTNTGYTAITEDTMAHSVVSSTQGSSVVDAIAQTMVGEWMFKYVRRRKSFGVDGKAGTEENSNSRHKRWVWLAPYERAILWSSKQPTSGTALMGKPGRKLIIQSVLDVKDDNPPPKGINPIFNRSILILTPQRALKFTATSAERHYLWLTSLSFLAHSQQAVPEILPSTSQAAPPPTMGITPSFEFIEPKSPKSPKRIRDSIRLTKGKNSTYNLRGAGSMISEDHSEEPFPFADTNFATMNALTHQRELSKEAAEPPFIPRFHERGQERVHERANQVVLHGRKRSNTAGHIPPPLSFRGFHGPKPTSADSSSVAANSSTGGSSDMFASQGSNGMAWGVSQGDSRTSDASSRPPANNFFEALGTVRMEAFISPLAHPENVTDTEELKYKARRRSKEIRRNRSRSRTRRDSFTSRGSRVTAEDDYFRSDPFRGF